MPLFRRHATPADAFTVGSHAHRVVTDSGKPGIDQLDGLGDYVEAISRRRPPGPDGRDTIAVLNAKMDHADAVNDLVAATVLAFEELLDRRLVDPALAPAAPPSPRLRRDLPTYDYIQLVHARAVERRAWLEGADALLRRCAVRLMPPLSHED